MRSAGAVGTWLGWWGVLFAIYLLLAAKLTAPEIVVGAAAAALAATGTTVAAHAGQLHFRPRLSWLRLLGHVVWRVVADSGIVGLALWRQIVRGQSVEGAFRIVPFDGGGADAVSAARRALVTAGASLAPEYLCGRYGQRAGRAPCSPARAVCRAARPGR